MRLSSRLKPAALLRRLPARGLPFLIVVGVALFDSSCTPQNGTALESNERADSTGRKGQDTPVSTLTAGGTVYSLYAYDWKILGLAVDYRLTARAEGESTEREVLRTDSKAVPPRYGPTALFSHAGTTFALINGALYQKRAEGDDFDRAVTGAGKISSVLRTSSGLLFERAKVPMDQNGDRKFGVAISLGWSLYVSPEESVPLRFGRDVVGVQPAAGKTGEVFLIHTNGRIEHLSAWMREHPQVSTGVIARKPQGLSTKVTR